MGLPGNGCWDGDLQIGGLLLKFPRRQCLGGKDKEGRVKGELNCAAVVKKGLA